MACGWQLMAHSLSQSNLKNWFPWRWFIILSEIIIFRQFRYRRAAYGCWFLIVINYALVIKLCAVVWRAKKYWMNELCSRWLTFVRDFKTSYLKPLQNLQVKLKLNNYLISCSKVGNLYFLTKLLIDWNFTSNWEIEALANKFISKIIAIQTLINYCNYERRDFTKLVSIDVGGKRTNNNCLSEKFLFHESRDLIFSTEKKKQ